MKITEQYLKSIKWEGKDKFIGIGDGLALKIRKSVDLHLKVTRDLHLILTRLSGQIMA